MRIGVLASRATSRPTRGRWLAGRAVPARSATPRSLDDLDGLVIPGGGARRSRRRSSATGSSRRSAPITAPAGRVLGTCAGMIVCDRDAPRPDRRDRRAATPSGASCRASRPTSRSRALARAAARGVHPRAVDRRARGRGGGAGDLRGAPGRRARGADARVRVPSRADRRLAAPRAVHGNGDRRASASGRDGCPRRRRPARVQEAWRGSSSATRPR